DQRDDEHLGAAADDDERVLGQRAQRVHEPRRRQRLPRRPGLSQRDANASSAARARPTSSGLPPSTTAVKSVAPAASMAASCSVTRSSSPISEIDSMPATPSTSSIARYDGRAA